MTDETVPPADWSPPPIASGDLQWTVGTSSLDEFVLGHNPLDVLRELVQNEYDAGGRFVDVRFEDQELIVRGNGRSIDDKGWLRLSVMFGTGETADGRVRIPPKVNSLGSKNFGLKSLFLLGDTVYVRSGGRQTVLDRRRGARKVPAPDPTTLNLRGAVISVPYRNASVGILPVFSISAEAEAFDLLERHVAATMIKLAQPHQLAGIAEVKVHSTRLARSLRLRQTGKETRLGRSLKLIDRRAELEARDANSLRSSESRELEFQTNVLPPRGIRPVDFPSYFMRPGGRVVVGLSVRLLRRSIDPVQQGTVYYPLGAPVAFTGNGVSINAPFEMNTERSQPRDPGVSPWNAWLLEQAAVLGVALIREDWYHRFGANAFAVWTDRGGSVIQQFVDRVHSELAKTNIWPSRRRGSSGRPLYKMANHLAIPELSAFDGFLDSHQLLDHPVALNSASRELARLSGSSTFTMNSLVRLRCAGPESRLKTVMAEGESDYFEEDFPKDLVDPGLQLRFSDAFDAGKLSDLNRADLRQTPTTLTAAGTLAPCSSLIVLAPELAEASIVPRDQQLHQALVGSKVLARQIAKPFRASNWVTALAESISKGGAAEPQLEALYRYLLSTPRLTLVAWAKLRMAPVIRDAQGRWTAPANLILPNPRIPSELLPVLHIAPRSVAGNTRLTARLRLRKALSGADLVNCARLVANNPHLAKPFVRVLSSSRRLLHRPIVRSLTEIACLPKRGGGVGAPRDLYIRSLALNRVLADDVDFVEGDDQDLFRRLGCLQSPVLSHLLARIKRLQTSEEALPNPEQFYIALLESLQRARRPLQSLEDEEVLWTGSEWSRPSQALVGRRHLRLFGGVVPVVVGMVGPYARELGAPSDPQQVHWRALLEAISGSYAPGTTLDAARVEAIRSAIENLDRPPDGLDSDCMFLLDRVGRLFPLSAATSGIFLLNDDPDVADAFDRTGSGIAFADNSSPAAVRFFQNAGVRQLTEAYVVGQPVVGAEKKTPDWLPLLLRPLHQSHFAPALARLVALIDPSAVPDATELAARFKEIESIRLVGSIQVSYQIGRHQTVVAAQWALTGGHLNLVAARSRSASLDLITEAIAQIAHASRQVQRQLVDKVYRLLECDTEVEVAAYMRRCGIGWSIATQAQEAAPDDEDDSFDLLGELLRGRKPSDSSPSSTAGHRPESDVKPERAAGAELPPLDQVTPEELDAVAWSPGGQGDAGGGGGGATGGVGRIRDFADREADLQLGSRGEEIIYRDELRRIAALGQPANLVRWTSQTNPVADHDILSVAADGEPLYIEVKTTADSHGKFIWPRSEFDRAVRERDHYELCRVYQGRSTRPKFRRFRDPVGLLLSSGMRVDLDTLAAEVQPLERNA